MSKHSQLVDAYCREILGSSGPAETAEAHKVVDWFVRHLREPTEAMLSAGGGQIFCCGHAIPTHEVAAYTWPDMVDAINTQDRDDDHKG